MKPHWRALEVEALAKAALKVPPVGLTDKVRSRCKDEECGRTDGTLRDVVNANLTPGAGRRQPSGRFFHPAVEPRCGDSTMGPIANPGRFLETSRRSAAGQCREHENRIVGEEWITIAQVVAMLACGRLQNPWPL